MDKQLTEVGKQKMLKIDIAILSASLLGGIGGVIYSKKTGGGFWRGVGYFVVGSILLRTAVFVATIPAQNKILNEDSINVDNTAETKQYAERYAQSLVDSGGYQ